MYTCKKELYIVAMLVVMAILLFGCSKEEIIVNQSENVGLSQNKIYIPEDAVCKKYTWEQICDYFGQDMSLKNISSDFSDDVKNQSYELYVDNNGTVVFDNIKLFYEGKNGQYIRLTLSKGKVPVLDEMYSGGKATLIQEMELYIYKKDDVYQTTFLFDGIGYDLMTGGIAEEDFIKLLKEILK